MGKLILAAAYSDQVEGLASHFHDCHQLLYVKTGQIQITVSGKTYLAGPGNLVLISRFETHSIQVLSREYSRYTLQIAPQAIYRGTSEMGRLLSVLVNRPENFHHVLDLSQWPVVETIMEQLAQEHGKQQLLETELSELMLLELMIYAVRTCPELLEPGKNLQLIRQVQAYFENHYRERIVLEELAKLFHVSASYLSHQFKQITGISVMGYLQSCRIAAAKDLLAHTQLEIGAVVESVGFSDSSNFSRAFKAETGLTPRAFRSRFGT